ncbi:flagellar basal-body MS-ring/collar protein FliF [Ornithinibacillus bavariensis]|uniref:Flagellar M-ring protein n=1 Tax=Ornithinibacillus bavariensis TaxID=545502 RepID=A0A919X8P7_9BACI|nr:flagellar basal-body MS-ring/collar protein FliF [Ornithinibacillus bavariensis]GIO26148.1 flagellar M-ring protein [Ornithinibacillus bavariensis]
MNEKIMKFTDKAKTFWSNRSKGQKGIIIGSSIAVIVLIAVISLFATKSNYVPLYRNLSVQEVGQIKSELDARGIPYELQDAGKTILVPDEQADSLLVDLAVQGIPDSGNIDYSFFSKNASWGITDNEFNVMKLDAMQTELANLIKRIDGINDATVMITMPKEPVFVSESTQPTSAAIMIETAPGYKFQGNQINALYQLVSKAVPNLEPENISIMNQYFEYYDQNAQNASGYEDAYAYQQTVKQDIERDIQRRLQQMLGTMVGMNNVIVSVTADVDFTKENRVEEIIEPVDPESMEGLPVSVETIRETYTGNGAAAGGIAGAGDEDIANYPGGEEGDNGEYEYVKETVNNEFNRIHKEIAEAPYKVRDLGIQVAVNKNDLDAQQQMTVEQGITSILNSIITTSIDGQDGEVIPDEKTSIVFQEFNGSNALQKEPGFKIPLWLYIVGGLLLLVIVILIILLMVRKPKVDEEIEEDYIDTSTETVPDIEVEDNDMIQRKKQLEKLAKDKPEEFAKLLRGWIGED